MNNKNIPIIVAVLSAVLCGCPGACSLLFGGMFATISLIPGAEINVMGSSDPQAGILFGLSSMCIGAVMVAVMAGAIFWAWRERQKVSA